MATRGFTASLDGNTESKPIPIVIKPLFAPSSLLVFLNIVTGMRLRMRTREPGAHVTNPALRVRVTQFR